MARKSITDTGPSGDDLIAGLFARAREGAEAANEVAVAGQVGGIVLGAYTDLAGRLAGIAKEHGDLATAIAVISGAQAEE